MKYECSECHLAVIVLEDGKTIKACSCEAAIIANMEAEAHGSGGII